MHTLKIAAIAATLWSGALMAAPCADFNDVEDTSPFCPNVTWIKNRQITLGCAANLYCPNDPVTRLQMAAFLNRLGDALFPLNCASGQVMKWNGTTWACANDDSGAGGGTVTSVTAGTGLVGSPNPITSAGSINLAGSYQLPQGCSNGQVPKSDGAGGWTCQADASGGSGTVTSVGTGTGLTGGPITTIGTIGLAATQLLPATACTNGQVAKWNGAAWACAADNDTNSGGTVTSVASGTGLTGGPVTGSGTIAIATGFQLPQGCTNGQVAKSDGAGAWTCQADATGGNGTVTSVATGAGLTGGPVTTTGTIGLAATQLMPTSACSSGQVPKWNGSAWACGADNDTNSGGTVTSVATGAGLTGGPVTTTGTIGLAATQLLPTSACSSGQVAKWNGSAWACGADNDTNSGGTVTSVATGAGLTGGPVTTTGTIGLAATQLMPTSACSSGQVPKWNGSAWACGADNDTNSGGTVTSVGTGAGLTGGPIAGSGTIGVDTTYLQRRVAASCASGSSIRAIAEDGAVTCETDDGGAANAFVQNGNAFGADAALGTTDNFALDIRVNNTRIVRYEPHAISPNIISGFSGNNVTVGVRGATIAGGGVVVDGDPDHNFEGPNRVTDNYGTVGGGFNNRTGNDNATTSDSAAATVGGGFGNVASNGAATIAGGDINLASGIWSSVGGGINNNATEVATTIAGGYVNSASGAFGTVPGGRFNTAGGEYSMAAGRRAKALNNGSFAWADSNDFDFNTMATDEFAVRATGGARLVLGIDGAGAPTWTCSVVSGGSWSCSSDRNLKQNLVKLDGQAVLAQLRAMPVYAWNPKGQNGHIRHFGPTAQDFHGAFGLGSSALHIEQQDADGVALAAIQGVDEKLEAREAALRRELAAKTAEIGELKRELAELRTGQQAEVAELRRAVEVLMARTSAEGRMAQAR